MEEPYNGNEVEEAEINILGLKEDESDKVGWEQTIKDFIYQDISFVFTK